MSALSTIPTSITFGAAETWSVGIDCTGALSPYPAGTVPTAPATTLRPVQGGPATSLPAPTIAGNQVVQRIPQSVVSPGQTYKLTLTFTPSGTQDVLEVILQLVVPPES